MNSRPSPNFNERSKDIHLQYIVLHYTDMKDEKSAVERLCDPASEVSAHYLINEEGAVTQLVDESKRAWHAGASFWRGISDLNSASIGIELVNTGHSFGYKAFPAPQITSLKKLMHEIVSRHHMSSRFAPLAHSDIAPTRKKDPGELFPWQNLAQENLGVWPQVLEADYTAGEETEAIDILNKIGYETVSLKDTLLAFQRHYCPQNLTGKLDAETLAKLRALKRQMI